MKMLDTANPKGLTMAHELQRKPLTMADIRTKRYTTAKNGRLLPLNSDAWAKLRRMVLAEQPLCPECEIYGKTEPAVHVDHIDNNASNNARENLVGLCHSHHSRKTWHEQRGIVYLAPLLHPYNLRQAKGETTIVCGPAGGGKTTYVKENAKPGDVYIDLDLIRESLPPSAQFHEVLAKRNQLLNALADTPRRAWFIVSSPINSERDWWARKLGTTDVRLLDTPIDVCIERINASRHGEHKTDSLMAARKWWAEYEMQQPSKSQAHRAHGCDADGVPLDPSHHWNS